MTLPSFIWDSPLKTFKVPCISLWTEPQSYYSCHIPCTLHSLCNDVSNNLLMLTAPCDGIFYLRLAMTQAAGVTSAPVAFSTFQSSQTARAYVVGLVSPRLATAACHCINYCQGIQWVQIIQNALLGPICFTCQWSE